MCGISLSLEPNIKVVVCCVYRPPKGDINTFFNKLSSALNFVTKNKFDFIILCGDLNINLFDKGLPTRLLCDMFESFQLEIAIREPTRIFQNVNGQVSSTAIDYLVTNMPTANFDIQVYDAFLADHLAHLFSFSSNIAKNGQFGDSISKLKRTVNEVNLQELNVRLRNTNFNYVLFLDPNEAFNMFLSDVQWCFDVACPFKYTKIKRPNSNDNGWVTNEIIQEGQILKSTFNKIKSKCRRIFNV